MRRFFCAEKDDFKNAGFYCNLRCIIELRRSLATHLLDKGTGISIIQKLLGHNDIRTTVRYLHISHKDLLGIVSPIDHLNIKNVQIINGEEQIVVHWRNGWFYCGNFFIVLIISHIKKLPHLL